MKALVALIAVVAITLGLSGWVGSKRANAGLIRPQTEESSRLLQGGRVRCTASVKSEVQVGHAVSVQFTLHNVSKHSVKVSLWVFSAQFALKAADGTIYNTGGEYAWLPGIPPPLPKKLPGGTTLRLGTPSARVRWTGPLQITPECLGKDLPVLHVGVAAPWPRPSENTAIGSVVAAAGHLLDHCRPPTPGVPVDGQIFPPSGPAPPMNARCSISVNPEGRFLDAQVLVLIPAGLAGVQIYQPYETLWPIQQALPLAASPPYEAIAWEFVVTRDRAIPVASATIAATNDSSQPVLAFEWNGTSWQSEAGSCGGTLFSAGGPGAYIEFISACTG